MTEVILAKVDQNPEQIELFSKTIAIVFMVIGLSLSGSLLKWTVGNKLASVENVTDTTITAQVRDKQLACLARNIYYEAGSEPFEGKVAVAQVTLNRAASGQFPNDVCKVVYQKNVVYEKILCQFSWVCEQATGVKPANKAMYDESMVVAQKVLLENYRLPSLNDAMYFHGDYINPGWKRTKVAKIGRHIFYK